MLSVKRPRIFAATSVELKKHLTKTHTIQNIKVINKETYTRNSVYQYLQSMCNKYFFEKYKERKSPHLKIVYSDITMVSLGYWAEVGGCKLKNLEHSFRTEYDGEHFIFSFCFLVFK
jgi:hypothetical protein